MGWTNDPEALAFALHCKSDPWYVLPTYLPLKGYLEVAMEKDGNKVFIVYFSPSGSTRHVVGLMEKRFKQLGIKPSMFDLA